MSGTEDFSGDEASLLAGEYVLGVLGADESRAVRTRAEREPTLAAAIAWWEDRLHPLTLAVAPVAPPDALWQRIEASIASPAPRARPTLVWSNPRFWQATTGAAMALAAGVAAFAFLRAPPPPQYIAALAPLNAPGASFVAETAPDGSIHVRALTQVAVATGKDLQLWALPEGAAKPISLGVLPAEGRVVQPGELPRGGTKLLVSLEPAGGSPTGQPTGPVLFGGTLTLVD